MLEFRGNITAVLIGILDCERERDTCNAMKEMIG